MTCKGGVCYNADDGLNLPVFDCTIKGYQRYLLPCLDRFFRPSQIRVKNLKLTRFCLARIIARLLLWLFGIHARHLLSPTHFPLRDSPYPLNSLQPALIKRLTSDQIEFGQDQVQRWQVHA